MTAAWLLYSSTFLATHHHHSHTLKLASTTPIHPAPPQQPHSPPLATKIASNTPISKVISKTQLINYLSFMFVLFMGFAWMIKMKVALVNFSELKSVYNYG